jgi:predicted acyl esterase
MSALYGTLKGAKGMATRCGHRELTTHAASWDGAVRVSLNNNKETGSTSYVVELVPWHGNGEYRKLAEGIMERRK